jgi:hypothetical protein
MTRDEFRQWMDQEVARRRMTTAQRDDLLAQKSLFESQYANLRESFLGKVVGFAQGQFTSVIPCMKSSTP